MYKRQEQQGSDVDIIGQFGVGFYSAFMVASHVKVVSRAYGEDCLLYTSHAGFQKAYRCSRAS